MVSNKKKVYAIINPVSGTSSKHSLPHHLAEELDAHRFELHIFITGYAGHGSEIAQLAIDNNVDYVIAAGGDGTVNEVARTLIGSDTALAIIPLGSGNGLARDLHIPLNPKAAIQIIKEENVNAIDYGIANDHIFFCTCGMGFDAMVSQKAANEKKRGSIMYLKTMLESFFQLKPQEYEIICAEGTLKDKAFVVTCANASQYGYNAYIAPNADIQDGLMNIAILKPLNILDVPQTTLQLFSKNMDNNNKLIEILTNEVTIKREKEGVIHVDGDPVETSKDIHVRIIPKGLKVLTPTNVTNSKFTPTEILSNILRWV
ncbi:diacylglycerol kinase (ATP) [Dysgonomonas sp. PH5-45]|uniref:diacylglycerol/lipid kinase family protein n=1 Tax=unclassified Dysgonomonas TaxID=2630389 RepID=UPI002474F64B|nr:MULTISPECIES: diacylglycerol kinase family protein [unclassified Dysgonomonas]MDH6354034.1 diacylglycerol kinase (ATP) [Dysgonomonas sp. PH5-45]MDH6386936.1 diacylglycerol kinase (ATP) [Dysgonomonas sp. PH5-37]